MWLFVCLSVMALCLHVVLLCLFNRFIPVSFCWQLYTELSQRYQALVSSEANLRQSHQETSALLARRDKDILQLQSQLQLQQQQIQKQQQQHQQQAQHTSLHSTSNKQTNFKVITGHYPQQKSLLKIIRCFKILV